MTEAEQLRRLYVLLDQALDMPATEHERWLNGLSPDDQTLASRLRELLRHAVVETDDFMQRPAAEQLPPLGDAEGDEDLPGERVGPYRLVAELGHGGMASVWLAEREDGGLQRQVALKLPRLGGGQGLVQRMAVERDLLSALEHPNIARLYDAGVTPEGRPWLAMERVQGEPIDVYCRTRGAGVREILGLALQACSALAHAHARLIVHRDLKPANLLVTAEGELRLVDFGIAKLLEDQAHPGPALTQVHGAALTPDYASPEQVARRPLTVATDVYSLGVVLYELLTGERPYKLGRPSAAALEEAILSAEIPLASARVSQRPSLARQLRGDIDNILAKALRKEVARRYTSVESLASDLQRHLNGEPVLAQPRSRWYRLAKFVSRHRVPVLSASVAGTVLVAALGAALWQSQQARVQAEVALRNLELAETSFEFAETVLMEGMQSHEVIRLDELLRRSVLIAERSFGQTPVQRAVAVDAAASWLMATGQNQEAQKLLERTLASFPPGFQSPFASALRCKLGNVLIRMGQQQEGVRQMQTGLQAVAGDSERTVYCLQKLAGAASAVNDAATQLRYMQQAEQAFAAGDIRSPQATAQLWSELAGAYALNGRGKESDDHFRRAIDLFAANGRGESELALTARNNWGVAMLQAGDPRAAAEQLEQAVVIYGRRSATGQVPGALLGNKVNALNAMARHEEALAVATQMLEQARASDDGFQQVRALAGQAVAQLWLGRAGQAQDLLDEAALILQRFQLPMEGPAGQSHRAAQGLVWQASGQAEMAHNAYTTVAELYAKRGSKLTGRVSALVGRSETALTLQRPQQALTDATEALAMAKALQGDRPVSLATGRAWLALAQVQRALGSPGDARRSCEQALLHLENIGGQNAPYTRKARQLAADLG